MSAIWNYRLDLTAGEFFVYGLAANALYAIGKRVVRAAWSLLESL